MTAPTPEPDRYYGNYYEDEPPVSALRRAPRQRRRGLGCLIALAILVALLIGADRVAAAVTENQLAGKIQSSQNLNQKPSVSIDGFPFLTQVISRHFDHATVDINNLDARGVPIQHIHADLRGVHVSSGYNSATVDTLNGTATLSYDQVATALSKQAEIGEITLAQGTGNQVKASYSIAGISVSADVTVSVLSGNELRFTTTKVHTPLSGLGLNTGGFDVKVPLGGMPFGMQLKDLQVTSTGVDISATGQNVVLTGQSANTGR
ncbi:MAG TPA: DUF2993 domain-containing protein [Actinocrinis sp.]|nr:DUF2993 domain-containing protein [Actinocrinis sp.]